VVVLVPVASANHITLDDVPEGRLVRPHEYTIHAGTGRSFPAIAWNGTVINFAPFEVRNQTTLEVHNRTHYWEAGLTLFWEQATGGQGGIQVRLDGQALTRCRAASHSINAGLAQQHGSVTLQLSCELPDLENGSHTISMAFTTNSGTMPNTQVLSVGERVTQIDYELLPMDINLSPELMNFIWLLAMTGLLIFFLDRKAILPAIMVTIAGLLLVLPIVTDPLAWGIIGLYIFLWLHYAAKNGLTNLGRREGEGV
jgi:hypothetical protein